MNVNTKSLTNGTIFTITQLQGRKYEVKHEGTDYSSLVPFDLQEEAFSKGLDILFDNTFKLSTRQTNTRPQIDGETNISSYIHKSPLLRPDDLIMSDLNWKFLVRNVLKGKNILMAGYTGAGKTTFAKAVATLLDRPFFKIPLGASQDPRATLIGSTFFHKDKGTVFIESEFVRAIQTENAVILLDEYTRAHPDAENILMTVLDGQRYLKLDEHEEQLTINVAKGVSFIATANFGVEFTTTRTLDRATLDRFLIIEMPMLTQDQELGLLKIRYPNVNIKDLKLLTKLTSEIRKDFVSGERKYGNMVSTRICIEIAEILEDNFTLAEALEVAVLPLFSTEGDTDSERTNIKLLIDSIIPVTTPGNNFFGNGQGIPIMSPDNIFAVAANAGI